MLPRSKPGLHGVHQHKSSIPSPKRDEAAPRKWRRNKLAIAQSKHLRQSKHLCELCGLRLAEELHHIVPLNVAMHLAADPSNHQAVCKECHAQAHKH